MPFKSKAQQGFMFSEHPEMAKEWAAKTPNMKALPEHVKHMADGGDISAFLDDRNAPGLQDATVSDFLLPALGAPVAAEAGEALPALSDALGEAGEASLGGAEEAPKVEAYIKGMQQNPYGDAIKVLGVKGEPSEIAKLGFGEEPGSIPEDVLRKFGIEVPPSAPLSQDPSSLSANDLRRMWGEVAQEQSGTPIDAIGHYTRPDLVTRSTHMAKGGEVKGYSDGGDVQAALAQLGIMPSSSDFDVNGGGSVPASIPLPSAPTPGVQLAMPSAANNYSIIAPQQAAAPQPSPAPAPAPVPQQAPTQVPPSLSQAAGTIQNTAPTSPDIYAGIGAPDRAALAQKLLAQKASPGNLAASGVGGLGDAITSAFGKSPTNFQGNIRNAQAQNAEQKLGIMDTERQQKMQDIQAKMAVQESDPNSPFSQGMRQFLKAQGMNVPSGMSAAMLKQTLPDVSKIFESKMLALTQQGAQGVEAGKALMGETLWEQIKDSLGLGGQAPAGENYLASRVEGATPAASSGTQMTTPSGIKYSVSK